MTATAQLAFAAGADPRYQQIVELSPDGIVVHANGVVVMVNAAAVRLMAGTRHAQLIGRPIEMILDPPYLKAVQMQLAGDRITTDSAPAVPDTLHRLDGTSLAVEVRTVAFVYQGQPAAQLIIRDITDRLAAEQAASELEHRLQQAQRMETIGALAGGVAHEVNNMLQVILGFGGFLVIDSRLPAECLPDVQQIVQAATRAGVVTGQLLAYGRRGVHRPQMIALQTAIRALEPMLRSILREHQHLILRGTATLYVWADPGQLQQVLVNLVLNASAALAVDGTITITVAPAELSGAVAGVQGAAIPAGRYAALHVRDDGAGIDATVLPHIFEPFFTTKPLGEGTGLGLPAVLGILEQNHGYLTVVTAPGEGSTFNVYLAIHPAPAEPARVETHEQAGMALRLAQTTVLVVDDEPAVRQFTVRLLTAAGYQVTHAANGGEALDIMAQQGPPDLLLTDLTMHQIGGLELAERAQLRWPALPIIFMSGFSAEGLKLRGIVQRPGRLLEKPFTPEALLEAVATAMNAVPVPS